MLYPLLMQPVFKSALWGGRNLTRFGKDLPPGIVAESWELSAHADGVSRIGNGAHAGRALPELVRELGELLVGSDLPPWAREQFPLLVKFIDAKDRLSVQVHPDDGYAARQEAGGLGKTEMWLVLDAEPGAELVMGLTPGTDRQRLIRAIEQGTILDCLQRVPARPGMAFYIPAGRVHAVGSGIVILEIQQSSNTTYRLYDYDRVDASGQRRQLHQENALEVIAFAQDEPALSTLPCSASLAEGGARQILVASPYFVVERLTLAGTIRAASDGSRFFTYTLLTGHCTIESEGGTVPVAAGQSLLVPASLGRYRMSGSGSAILSYVPDERLRSAAGVDAASLTTALACNLAALR
jgi:mannose-6-phosphate isomerase